MRSVQAGMYTGAMTRLLKSATLQMRVTPAIKYAVEHVLSRMGLNTSDAIEMYFRFLVAEQRLPFEVKPLDPTLSEIIEHNYTQAQKRAKSGAPGVEVKKPRRQSKKYGSDGGG